LVRKTGLSRDGGRRVELGERDAVAAGEGDVVGAKRTEPLDVGVVDLQAAGGEVVERSLGVDRVVEDDRVEDQAERAELFFLALAVALAQLAAVAVADVAGEGVAALAAVEVGQDPPASSWIGCSGVSPSTVRW
jgi:hypothetical protein